MRDKNSTAILIALNKLLEPEKDLNTISFEFHKIGELIKVSGKKIETLTNLDLFSDSIRIQFCEQPGLNTVLKELYKKSDKKFDKNSLAMFYFYDNTFLGVLNTENLNHRLLINLIESFNLPD